MRTEEMIEVMQAFEDGKVIEKSKKSQDKWTDSIAPTWNWYEFDYRIKEEEPKPKPQPQYRPYADTEELRDDFYERFLSASYFVWLTEKSTGNKYFITAFYKDKVMMVDKIFTMKELLEEFVYKNCTPVGKLCDKNAD